ncbi:MAG TPA: glycosyltransferase family 4 protein [Pyrinomonadaceae bacterium]|jgi:glycosyltransferase involved in cell wall biosynthesis|nr:glycosyltransferase family 4 protein [Pyrinomonadaceae bacterium]
MSRKVVLFGPYPPPHGGVSIYVAALYASLKSRGLRLWTYGDEELKGACVRFMRDKRREVVPLVLGEGRGARVADCTHFLFEYPSALVPVWVILKRLLGFEWVKIVQDGSLPARHARFRFARRALFRMAARNADEFVVLSEELRRWLRDEVGVKQNVSLIRNLFPVPYLDADAPLPPETEDALADFMRRAKRVASIGVFIADYGFLHTAEAVERLRRETGEDFGLLLLDGGFASDDAYREEVLRGREWITVLRNVAHANVFTLLKRCDAFVRGTSAEGYGLSRVEAMWCGLSVVATRAGETRGMLLYDFGDVDALAAQLRRALSGEHARVTEEWAARYRREAEENLAAITSKLFED